MGILRYCDICTYDAAWKYQPIAALEKGEQEMRDRATSLRSWVIVLAMAMAVTGFAQEVPLEFEESGDGAPGGAVSVTVSTTDGSTIQSVSWEQVAGVDASLSGADTATVTVNFSGEADYKDYLIHVLEEPPIGEDQLPPNVPPPSEEFYGGLQNRWEIVAVNPFAYEHASAVVLDVMVTTSSGTYETEHEVFASLPWQVSSGISNVPVGLTVLLNGKEQASYDWALTLPGGSSATLMDPTGQYPEFTPDVMGQYSVRVTDLETGEPVTLVVYAGTWQGVIVGQDADGRPVSDSSCTNCHNGSIAPDAFTPWAQTGHAEIATDQLNEGGHWGEGCFACHTVGYNTNSANGGFDDAADYQAFLDSGLINSENPGNWTTMLAQYPAAARMMNVQCENCHGPQMSAAHTQGDPRQNISSNVCATCHGEPLRHGRFQQWQLSAHANYELAVEEGQSGTCSKCHTGNGFLAWLPVLDGTVPGDPEDSVEVTWTEDETHPQTCQTCHDPHAIGTTSGSGETNATVRISGDTPLLLAGFVAEDVGRGAICMTCHNTRRGLKNDETWDGGDGGRAPHSGAQTDVLMGQNAYFVEVGDRSFHSLLEDSCVDCHMEATPPPDELSYNMGGTNHTFYARPEICSECHSVVTAPDVQEPTEEALNELHEMINAAYSALIAEQLDTGASLDLDGERTVSSASEITGLDFTETHGRQALGFEFADGMELEEPIQLRSIDVLPAEGDPFAFYDVIDDYLIKSGWNYLLFHSDGSLGVHNPSWTAEVIETTMVAIESGGGIIPGGGDANPVACESDYVYWTEIAARNQGAAGSVWRTDVVARNATGETANVEFILHSDNSGLVTGMGAVDPMAQGIFEDVIGALDFEGKGALEICSDQPLEVFARIYNLGDDGTFGQALDGINYSGMGEGDSARLLGLRQMQGEFRTNINVTNTGMDEAEVEITLYATDGSEVHAYTLMVGSGMSVQDIEPFRTRAGEPNVGWGFAEVEVVSGEGIVTSGSVIDSRTNDATSIPMKW